MKQGRGTKFMIEKKVNSQSSFWAIAAFANEKATL
jgi:hypothetical protein